MPVPSSDAKYFKISVPMNTRSAKCVTLQRHATDKVVTFTGPCGKQYRFGPKGYEAFKKAFQLFDAQVGFTG